MAQTRSAQAINQRENTRSITYSMDRENEVSKNTTDNEQDFNQSRELLTTPRTNENTNQFVTFKSAEKWARVEWHPRSRGLGKKRYLEKVEEIVRDFNPSMI